MCKNLKTVFLNSILLFSVNFVRVNAQTFFKFIPDSLENLPEKARIEWYEPNKNSNTIKNTYRVRINHIFNIHKNGKFLLQVPEDTTSYTVLPKHVHFTNTENYSWSGNIMDKTLKKAIGYFTASRLESEYYGEFWFNTTGRNFFFVDLGVFYNVMVKNSAQFLCERPTLIPTLDTTNVEEDKWTIPISNEKYIIYPNPLSQYENNIVLSVPNDKILDIDIYNDRNVLEARLTEKKLFKVGLHSLNIADIKLKNGLKYIAIKDEEGKIQVLKVLVL